MRGKSDKREQYYVNVNKLKRFLLEDDRIRHTKEKQLITTRTAILTKNPDLTPILREVILGNVIVYTLFPEQPVDLFIKQEVKPYFLDLIVLDDKLEMNERYAQTLADKGYIIYYANFYDEDIEYK